LLLSIFLTYNLQRVDTVKETSSRVRRSVQLFKTLTKKFKLCDVNQEQSCTSSMTRSLDKDVRVTSISIDVNNKHNLTHFRLTSSALFPTHIICFAGKMDKLISYCAVANCDTYTRSIVQSWQPISSNRMRYPATAIQDDCLH
jgi:hypothetical protein